MKPDKSYTIKPAGFRGATNPTRPRNPSNVEIYNVLRSLRRKRREAEIQRAKETDHAARHDDDK